MALACLIIFPFSQGDEIKTTPLQPYGSGFTEVSRRGEGCCSMADIREPQRQSGYGGRGTGGTVADHKDFSAWREVLSTPPHLLPAEVGVKQRGTDSRGAPGHAQLGPGFLCQPQHFTGTCWAKLWRTLISANMSFPQVRMNEANTFSFNVTVLCKV